MALTLLSKLNEKDALTFKDVFEDGKKSFIKESTTIKKIVIALSSIDFNNFDIKVLDTNIESNTDLFNNKIIDINKIYDKNKMLYFINLFFEKSRL